MPTEVAVIMRSKNEMPHLDAALDALCRQTYLRSLYVIDSGSTDGSLKVLRKHCDEAHLTQIPPEAYVPGKVLNEAIARTRESIIVLLNGDAIPCSDNWLERLIQPLLLGEADATYSRQVARPDARFIVAYDYERAYTAGTTVGHFFSAAACAFRRDLWERHRFPNEGYAEDAVWAAACRLLNARFQLVEEAEVEHSHNYTLGELYRKRYRHGVSFARALGEISRPGHRAFLCGKELLRDLLHACRTKQFSTIPYNIGYRVTIHTALHRGIREGSK